MEDTPRVGERAVVAAHRADRYGEERMAAAYRLIEDRSPQPDTVQDRPKQTPRSLAPREVLT